MELYSNNNSKTNNNNGDDNDNYRVKKEEISLYIFDFLLTQSMILKIIFSSSSKT